MWYSARGPDTFYWSMITTALYVDLKSIEWTHNGTRIEISNWIIWLRRSCQHNQRGIWDEIFVSDEREPSSSQLPSDTSFVASGWDGCSSKTLEEEKPTRILSCQLLPYTRGKKVKLFVCCVSLILARDKVERRMLSPPSTNVSRKSDCMGERRDYRTSMSCLSLHEKRGIEEKTDFSTRIVWG